MQACNLLLDRLRFHVCLTKKGQNCPDRLWAHPGSYLMGTEIPRDKTAGAWCWALTSAYACSCIFIPPYMPSWSGRGQFTLFLTFTRTEFSRIVWPMIELTFHPQYEYQGQRNTANGKKVSWDICKLRPEVSCFIYFVVAGDGLFQLCISEPVFPHRGWVKLVLTKISVDKSLNHWGL